MRKLGGWGKRDLSSVSQLMLAVLRLKLAKLPPTHTSGGCPGVLGLPAEVLIHKPFGNTGPVPRGCFPGR